MNLFAGMRQNGGASYGVVPGNGNPRADDKDMNVGPGHVVPAENTHLAKKVVKKLGYDPNVKVDMNQGNGMGADIKISSKEYFLNDEQVERMKNELGLDPEILSPNSDYNQRVNGGSTQDAKDMIQQKLKSGGGIWGKMNKNQLQINNNNQYPAYQDAGSTNPVQPAQNVEEVIVSAKRPENSGIQFLPLQELEIPGMNENRVPLDMNGQPINFDDPVYNPQITTNGTDPGANGTDPNAPVDPNLTPEEKYLQEMRDKNASNARGEKLANVGMGLWNLSRSREKPAGPTLAPMREVVRDYEGMKLQAKKDIESSTRGNMKKMRELGLTTQMVGADANTKEMTMKANSAIWDMMNKDQMYNAANDNARQREYYNKMDNFNINDARDANTFAEKKGQNIAQNAAQYFDVQENEFQNDAKLGGYQVNDEMDALDNEYNKLDVPAIRKSQRTFISRDDWYRMSDAERKELSSLKS